MNDHLRINRRPTIDDDASQSSNEDSDYNKLGETLVRATKFLGKIVNRDEINDTFEDPNLDIDRYRRSVNSVEAEKGHDMEDLNERYNAANQGNLYKCLRSSARATDVIVGGGHNNNVGLQDDALSFTSDDEGSEMSMPRIDEGNDCTSDFDEEGGRMTQDNDGGSITEEKPVVYVSTRGNMHRQASDISMHSIPSAAARRSSIDTENSATNSRDQLHRQSSVISSFSIPSTRRSTVEESDHSNHERRKGRRGTQDSSNGNTPRLLRAMGLGRQDSTMSIFSGQSRGMSQMSTGTDDSGEENTRIRRWFGTGAIDRMSNSFKVTNSFRVDNSNLEEDLSVTDNGSVRSGHRQTNGGSAPATINFDCAYTDHHAKSRVNFVKRNVNHAATDSESFRNLQKSMKEKGAVTGNAVRHMLQEAAEEHAVTNSERASIDMLGCLDDFDHDGANNHNNAPTSSTQSSSPTTQTSSYLGRAGSQHEEQLLQQHEAQQLRLEQDPMFGRSLSDTVRPYISIPSRESKAEILIDVVRCAADQGKNCLLTVRGTKFVGKSKLIRKVIDTVQIEGLGFTVLSSSRSANDAQTSFFAFREIMSAALRACDAVTQRSDESLEENGGDSKGVPEDEQENDESVMQRLIQQKILNKSDQLMIGRILPAVMNNQLLSLLKGRNPTALIKDIAASLFKIMIPLQPVMLVFEANGDDCEIDPSSWDLMEELLLSAGKQCPQMLLIAVSRHPLSIPTSIIDKHVDVHIEQMSRSDSEFYIRALFCDPNCIDHNMQVDSHVVDGVHDRAKGCPLFTERIVLWSQRKELMEMDETRNTVALNFPVDHNDHDASNKEAMLLETLPANLNEEILEVINNLPHHLLDALKVAACIGITFDLDKYKTMKDEGFHDFLQEVMATHGIFDETKGYYKWKHVAVYEAVESIIISNERIEIQGRIADSLRDLPKFHKCCIAQYARHCVMAERWDDAFDLYMEAGDKAEQKLDFVGAVGMYQQAKICLSKSRKKPSLQRRLSPHAALGWCLRELVRYEDAEMELEFCLKQTDAVPDRKRNAQFKEIELDVVTTLATLKQAESKYPEAIEMYERALPIARANKEKHSRVWLAHHVASCAEIHRKSGDLEQAKTMHTEALGYRELAVEEHSCTVLELALSFTQLGCTLSGLGDQTSRAYSLHKKALAARVEHLDFYHSLVSESLNYCADALQALGRGAEGIPLGMHAVKIRRFVFGPHHPAYAHALSVLASCYHSVGRSFDSLGLLRECLEICEKAFTKNHANMIPNLMLYGSVLSVAGNYEKARDVYERALSIHKMNFKEGQNAQQLVKMQKAMEELSSSSEPQTKAASLEMNIPSLDPDSSKTNVIVCADFGHRASDEYMLAVAASLQEMGTLKLVSVIAVSPPQVVRADIARGALDSLLLSNVPVAYSGAVSAPSSNRTAGVAMFNADYGKPSAHVNNTGVELITRALLQAPEKSLVIMCTACFGDVGKVIDNVRDLFARKVKQVIIIGSVKSVRRRSFIQPEECGREKDDAVAKNVYQSCQELKIPTVTLFKDISQGFPFSSTQVDDLTSSNHMVSTKIQRSEEMQMNSIWELNKQLKQEAKSYRTPKSLDIQSFYKYSLGGKHPNANQHNIWPSIKSINLELVLGLLSCIPVYRDSHFRWETHQVKGIEHKVCRHSNSAAGIIKPEALSNEIHMLIGFSLRNSLLNTSC
mmetsp:Transcript_32086/g.67460  ORF Transcript_32086/g.67460 Transcript_32086/m.67460 type:complete len:1702 (-) Transcript_32086:235-5340(-)|eukprot:CAMPEP_0172332166 /NCGR_PEP_ID=MMETSP1058-20130122/62297_1 /TAXON_ID=83371 /ORGANISM="Detonula confervacea, Strain CCMP 353" /LENGTH=1701 /DNA_ID=CAMNT_0013049443 /DNA_START=227 /DNA_END=5332 /DNA_ORIENTATION=+